MPYAILRFQKRKAGGVAACERHNERKNPLPTAATVTLTPCMTVMSMMTVFLGYPPRKSRHRHAAILLSEAVRRRIAGHSPALRESRGNVWHTTLQGKV